MILWETLRWALYWLASRTQTAPPPYVDPDWDEFLRNKYGIKQPFAKEE